MPRETKAEAIKIRLTTEERAALQRLADTACEGNVSQYVRRLIKAAIEKATP